jgi:hypothetical protein
MAGCAVMHPTKSFHQLIGHPPSLALQVHLAPQANEDSVVRFDAVVVENKSLEKTISKMDAATWFSTGDKGRCSYRGGPKAKVQFYSWELVPGQTFRLDVPTGTRARAVFGFADYFTPGIHRISLLTTGKQAVEMTAKGVHVLSQPPIINPALPVAKEDSDVCPDDPSPSSQN